LASSTLDGYFKDRSERWPTLDNQVNVLAIEADHPRRFVGDLEGESLHIKRRRAFGVFCLNQDIRARTVCLSPLSFVHEAFVEGAQMSHRL